MKTWLKEHLASDYKIEVESKGILEQADGPFPIELHDTDTFGKTLYMGGHFMTSEADEFVYHELMTHPALCTQSRPERVLIIGGGDGGAVEEVLKHPSVHEVVLVEIDGAVVMFADKHLREINKGKLFDPRVKVILTDGYDAVMNYKGEAFDLIVLDLTDPEGPAARLYTQEFFYACRAILRRDVGKLMLHLGPVWTHPKRVASTFMQAKHAFRIVRPFMAFVPLYGTVWTFAICETEMGDQDRIVVDWTLKQRNITDLKYYSGDIHRGMFELPVFVRKVIYGR